MGSLTLLLLCWARFAFASSNSHSDVAVLDDGIFDDEIQSNQFLAVKFYAPWCGHCKALAPVWEEIATELVTKGYPTVKVAKVDCTLNPTSCNKYEVKGYPTIILFDRAKSQGHHFNGVRDKLTIMAFFQGHFDTANLKATPGIRRNLDYKPPKRPNKVLPRDNVDGTMLCRAIPW